MSTWIKDNKSIASVIGVGALVFIGLTSFTVMKTMEANTVRDEYLNAKDKIASAAAKPQTPTEGVVAMREADLEAYNACIKDIEAAYAAYFPKSEDLEEIAPEQFRLKLNKVVSDFKTRAKDQNIRLNDGFNLGFDSYVTAPALQQATGVLQYELGAINWLAEQALDCDITELTRIYREKLPIETAEAPAAATDKGKKTSAKAASKGGAATAKKELYQVLPLSITLRGSRQSINKFINTVIDSEKYLFTIQAIRCLNEKNGALTIKQEPVKAQKGDSKGGSFNFGAALNKNKDQGKEVVTAEEIIKPVVGSEKVDFHIVLNLILFDPDKTTAAKPATASKK